MWSVIVGDKVFDISYKKGFNDSKNVYLGDKRLGSVYKTKKAGWDLFVEKVCSHDYIKGFITRDRAVEHLLKSHGYYWDETEFISEYLIYKCNMKED